MNAGKRIVLFDLYHGGHHAQYLTYLVQHWVANSSPGQLDLVIPEQALETDPGFRTLLTSVADHRVGVHPVAAKLPVGRPGFPALLASDLEHGRVLRQVVTTLKPDHCLLMYFDQVQLSLAFDLRFERPVALSGIYFRPSFHYAELGTGSPGVKDRLTSLRKRAMLVAASRNPHFRFLFSLDPFVLEYLPALPDRVEGVWLPDPVPITRATSQPEAFRTTWGVEPHRTLAVLFGVIDERKGVHELLRAAMALSPERQSRLCLAFFGPMDTVDRELQAGLQELQREHEVQVVVCDRFVGPEEGQSVLEAADLVLLPYRRHVGSSNVLIRAAGAGRPVLGSNYGIMGLQIDQNGLGVSVDCTDPDEIAEALSSFIDDRTAIRFDAGKSAAFAEANASKHFAETIFGRLLTAQENQ